jgi:hypothetical protein
MKAIKKILFFLKKILADVKKHSIFVALYHAKVAHVLPVLVLSQQYLIF